MKLPHVVVLSVIGMAVTSLSVLVFTSPRRAAQDNLTSNETEPSIVASVSPTPRLSLVLETDTTPSSVPRRIRAKGKEQRLGSVHLTSTGEPCSFFIDGKPVKDDVPLAVPVGPHKVRCERPNGDAIEKRVEVVEEAINPVFF